MLTWIADGVNDTISAVATGIGELIEAVPSMVGCTDDPMLTDFAEAEEDAEDFTMDDPLSQVTSAGRLPPPPVVHDGALATSHARRSGARMPPAAISTPTSARVLEVVPEEVPESPPAWGATASPNNWCSQSSSPQRCEAADAAVQTEAPLLDEAACVAEVPTPSTSATSDSACSTDVAATPTKGSPERMDTEPEAAAAAACVTPRRQTPKRLPLVWPPTPGSGEIELRKTQTVASPQQQARDDAHVDWALREQLDSGSSTIQGLLVRRSLKLGISLETYVNLEGQALRVYDELRGGVRNLLCDTRLSSDFVIQRTSGTSWRVVAPDGSRQEQELSFELCAASASDADRWEGHLQRACQASAARCSI
mmetsp:Transcript_8620/g.24820  ORF Transcript_8620/g.24820 Transcript_8620/m.24820 type:complete len:367 (+) Transcript_8620:79-1179(+)